MRILFVSSGNHNFGKVDNLTRAQGDSLISQGIDLVYFPVVGKGIKGYLRNVRKLRTFIKSQDFQLIHAHYGLSGLLAFFAASGQKLVVSFMGDDLLGLVSKNGNYTLIGKVLSNVNRFFARFIYHHNIVKSDNLHKKLWHGTSCSIIPNGVNFKVFFPTHKEEAKENLGMGRDKKIVLFAADPARPEKRFHLAEEAVNKCGDKNIKLLVIHNISQKELNVYYNASDVILLTSVHEGSPNVIKEAMACSRPIVSTDVGDVKKIIAGTEGCFIAGPDPDSLASAITKALEHSSTCGRDNIAHLESSTIARKITEVYKKTLSS